MAPPIAQAMAFDKLTYQIGFHLRRSRDRRDIPIELDDKGGAELTIRECAKQLILNYPEHPYSFPFLQALYKKVKENGYLEKDGEHPAQLTAHYYFLRDCIDLQSERGNRHLIQFRRGISGRPVGGELVKLQQDEAANNALVESFKKPARILVGKLVRHACNVEKDSASAITLLEQLSGARGSLIPPHGTSRITRLFQTSRQKDLGRQSPEELLATL